MKITAAIYARVSTAEQSLEMQTHDLRKFANQRGWTTVEYLEKESSVKKRPVFRQMLEDARMGKVNVILVWRIDRFARSMKDFVLTTLELHEWKVRLISVTEGVDTGDESPFAEFQRNLLAILAQLERKIIVSRVNAGIAEAKRQGKHCGRPVRVWDRDRAVELYRGGYSIRQIGAFLKVPVSTVAKALKGVPKGLVFVDETGVEKMWVRPRGESVQQG